MMYYLLSISGLLVGLLITFCASLIHESFDKTLEMKAFYVKVHIIVVNLSKVAEMKKFFLLKHFVLNPVDIFEGSQVFQLFRKVVDCV